MLIHPRVDQLTELRLRGMRDALEEQLQNPQSAELPFENWLACHLCRCLLAAQWS